MAVRVLHKRSILELLSDFSLSSVFINRYYFSSVLQANILSGRTCVKCCATRRRLHREQAAIRCEGAVGVGVATTAATNDAPMSSCDVTQRHFAAPEDSIAHAHTRRIHFRTSAVAAEMTKTMINMSELRCHRRCWWRRPALHGELHQPL